MTSKECVIEAKWWKMDWLELGFIEFSVPRLGVWIGNGQPLVFFKWHDYCALGITMTAVNKTDWKRQREETGRLRKLLQFGQINQWRCSEQGNGTGIREVEANERKVRNDEIEERRYTYWSIYYLPTYISSYSYVSFSWQLSTRTVILWVNLKFSKHRFCHQKERKNREREREERGRKGGRRKGERHCWCFSWLWSFINQRPL